MTKKYELMDPNPYPDLARHGAKRRGKELLLPGVVELYGNGAMYPIDVVKADPKLRADFVTLQRSELAVLNEIRREKTRLIAWLEK